MRAPRRMKHGHAFAGPYCLERLDCGDKPLSCARVQKKLLDIVRLARSNARPALWGAGALLIVAIFLYVIVPFVASTRIVKERIAFELSVWSGYQVSIDSDPEVRLFPFRAVLNGVKLAQWTQPGPPVMTADQMLISLSPMAALTGDIYFTKVRLLKPVLRVEPDASGIYLPRLPGGGRMANAVKDAQVLMAQNADDRDATNLPGDPFGDVEFFGGSIVDARDEATIVGSLEGVISWPRLDRSGSLRASGVWRGESVIVELSSTEPMLLLAGGTARTNVAFAGAPGNATFDGTINLSSQPFFQGEAAFSTSSLRRMLEWSQTGIVGSPDLDAVSIRGQVQGDYHRIKFEGLQMTANGSTGTGAAELVLDAPRPALSGTLALQQANLGALFAAFAPDGDPRSTGAIDPYFTPPINLDLRMSAAQANAGQIALADVAATAQIRDGLAVFDVSDARAFDGSIQAGMRFDRRNNGVEVETSIRATDIDGGAFAQALGLSRAVPASRGGFSLMLKGPVSDWDHFTDALGGTLTANFGPGTLPGIDLAAFVAKTQQGGFFALDEVAQGTLAVDRLDLKATIAANVARLDQAEIRSGQNTIALSGVVSYAGRGLALTGTIMNSSQTEPTAQPPGFFVGGTWSKPFISPALPRKID